MHTVETFRAVAYLRRSQDSGTGVSEEIQDEAIREYVERKGGAVAYWLPPDLDVSSWTLERASFSRARQLLRDGRANALVVAKLNRITRRRKDWEELLDDAEREGWTILSADYDLDLTTSVGRLVAGIIIDLSEQEYREKRKGYDDSRANAVLRHRVHGGDVAPLGYSWTVRGHDKKGNPLRGPLRPNAEAEKVGAAFEAFDCGASWKEVVGILGAGAQSTARSVLTNRVYLGEARSGDYVKQGAHPALVEEALFQRVQRKLAERARQQKPSGLATRNGQALLAKVLRCDTCGHALTFDRSMSQPGYRCKNMVCALRASIAAEKIEPIVLLHALTWHALLNPLYEDARRAQHVAEIEQELTRAQAAVAELDRQLEAGEIDAVSYGRAATVARQQEALVRTMLAETEASGGWLGMSSEAVQRRLFTDTSGPLPDPAKLTSVEAARSFVQQIVRVRVKPVGSGKKVPVEERIEVECLTPVAAAEAGLDVVAYRFSADEAAVPDA